MCLLGKLNYSNELFARTLYIVKGKYRMIEWKGTNVYK